MYVYKRLHSSKRSCGPVSAKTASAKQQRKCLVRNTEPGNKRAQVRAVHDEMLTVACDEEP